jgi:glycosyltransferase involved in cell wall biosynthesis
MNPATKRRDLVWLAKTLHHTIVSYGKLLDLEFGGMRPVLPAGPGRRSLLLLSWFFPPTINSGVFRPAALATYASRSGWETTVLSGRAPRELSPAGLERLGTVPGDVRVEPIEPLDLRPSYRFFPQIENGFPTVFATIDRGIEAVRNRPPSVVVATGPPFHLFVSAYGLARRFRAKLVLDYRDEWTLNPHDFVEPLQGDRAWEPRCLQAADLVAFTTRSQLENCLGAFRGLDPRRFLVLPNGWEPADFDPLVHDRPSGGGPVHELSLAFVGMLKTHCLPGPFLRSLGELLPRRPDLLSRLKIRFVGKRSEEANAQLGRFPFPQCIDLVEYVPKREANRVMIESSGLLLFNGPSMTRYLPGKIFDYLAAGPPILVVGEGGEIGQLVTGRGAGVVVPEGDIDALERAIDEIISAPRARWHSPDRDAWLAEHTRERLSLRMLEAIEKLDPVRSRPSRI